MHQLSWDRRDHHYLEQLQLTDRWMPWLIWEPHQGSVPNLTLGWMHMTNETSLGTRSHPTKILRANSSIYHFPKWFANLWVAGGNEYFMIQYVVKSVDSRFSISSGNPNVSKKCVSEEIQHQCGKDEHTHSIMLINCWHVKNVINIKLFCKHCYK